MTSAGDELVLSMGGITGRIRMAAPNLFLDDVRKRYSPFTIPSAPCVKSDFRLEIKARQSRVRTILDLSGTNSGTISVSSTGSILDIRRHDFDAHFRNERDRWIGSGSCDTSDLAFELLLRALWAALLIRAGGA